MFIGGNTWNLRVQQFRSLSAARVKHNHLATLHMSDEDFQKDKLTFTLILLQSQKSNTNILVCRTMLIQCEPEQVFGFDSKACKWCAPKIECTL